MEVLDPIYECNRACVCSLADCPNRVIQRGCIYPLEVFKTKYKGWAVRTKQHIPRGCFVVEYCGEVITEVEAESRSLQPGNGASYVWSLQPEVTQINIDRFAVDPLLFGNVARFINHSCNPNLVAKSAFVDHIDPRFPRLAFFATRDIAPFEELNFDYRYQPLQSPASCLRCFCGADKCRKILL